MRLRLSLLLPLLLLLAGAEALKGHDGIYECYITGSCQLCTHDEMQARGGATLTLRARLTHVRHTRTRGPRARRRGTTRQSSA